ncbi:hypothetical protein Dalu01_02452 [Deinococcus aluminii]|uniref:Uncharacterized protein n=1 Tax=Deinococcus aluminii TaxID=1656885 RepID=A0ABP9XFB9_9DEIO
MHRSSLFKPSSDLPFVVEFVDTPERMEGFLPAVLALLNGAGLVTRERLRVLWWSDREGP